MSTVHQHADTQTHSIWSSQAISEDLFSELDTRTENAKLAGSFTWLDQPNIQVIHAQKSDYDRSVKHGERIIITLTYVKFLHYTVFALSVPACQKHSFWFALATFHISGICGRIFTACFCNRAGRFTPIRTRTQLVSAKLELSGGSQPAELRLLPALGLSATSVLPGSASPGYNSASISHRLVALLEAVRIVSTLVILCNYVGLLFGYSRC